MCGIPLVVSNIVLILRGERVRCAAWYREVMVDAGFDPLSRRWALAVLWDLRCSRPLGQVSILCAVAFLDFCGIQCTERPAF